MPYIKSISLGTINSVTDTLCYGLDECDKVTGCYRNLKEMLIKLADFYLSGCTGHCITWFEEPYTFSVAVGGDGAPFGKDDTACAWLISLLNIGRAFLSGELSNSAKYFSSFANVSSDDAKNTQATLGRGIENTWKPWMYSARLKVVNEVEKLKAKLSKQPLSDSTKRSKMTSFIAQKKSRQEFEPSLVPSNSSIARYISEMKTKCGLSRLAKRIIKDKDLVDLQHAYKVYFTLNCFFFAHHPTAWTLGLVVPVHAKEMEVRYGMGLALNSMEGREAKHISIARYCTDTILLRRHLLIVENLYNLVIQITDVLIGLPTPTTSQGGN
ncbi:Hypothetical predicted protein, partial [Paramuricea clavata]